MLFKNPVRTSKRTPHFTITKINWLTLFKFKVSLDLLLHSTQIEDAAKQSFKYLHIKKKTSSQNIVNINVVPLWNFAQIGSSSWSPTLPSAMTLQNLNSRVTCSVLV
jgi:hypothetical protein